MTTTTAPKYYRIHLVRLDGRPIDTATGTMTFDHAYINRKNSKPHSPASIARKYNKRFGWKGYEVREIEVMDMDVHA